MSPPPSLPRDRNTVRVPCTIQGHRLFPCSLLGWSRGHTWEPYTLAAHTVPSLAEHVTNIPMSVPMVPPDAPTPAITSQADMSQVHTDVSKLTGSDICCVPDCLPLCTEPTLREGPCHAPQHPQPGLSINLYRVYGFKDWCVRAERTGWRGVCKRRGEEEKEGKNAMTHFQLYNVSSTGGRKGPCVNTVGPAACGLRHVGQKS